MKNYRFLIAFIILCLVVPFTRVSAEVTATIYHNGGAVGNNPVFMMVSPGSFPYGTCKSGKQCTYSGFDVLHMQAQAYKANLTTSTGTKSVSAVCIDPLFAAYQGGTVPCTPVDTTTATGAGLKYLMKTYGDATGSSLIAPIIAIRNLAYEAGVTSSANAASTAIGTWALSESSTLSMSDAAKKYAESGTNGTYVTQAQSLVTTAKGATPDAATGGDTGAYQFIFNKLGSSGGVINYKVTSNYNVTGSVNFTCDGCEIVSQSWPANGKTGNLTVKVDCSGDGVINYVINYEYEPDAAHKTATVSTDGAVYSCRLNNSSQGFLVYDGDNANDDETGAGKRKGKFESQESCSECRTTATVSKNIAMCCDDGGNLSSVIEPLIKDLFCDTNEAKVKVKGNKAGDQALSDYYDKRVNTYCRTYCTERAYVETPGTINGRNGKYFALPSGPKFDGYKTCRLVTDYQKWQERYVKYTKNANKAYNDYQKSKALADSYAKAYETISAASRSEKTVNGTANYSGTCSSDNCDDFTCTDTKSVSCTFTYKYDMDTAGLYKKYTYTKSKIDWNTSEEIQDYSGLTIKADGTSYEQGNVGGYYDPKWNDDDCGADSSMTITKSCTYYYDCEKTKADGTKYTGTCSGSENASGTGTYQSVDREFGKANNTSTFNSRKATAEQDAKSASDAYKAATDKLKELEDYLEECNTYYTEGDGFDSSNYGFNPSVQFVYYQVYVNGNSKVDVLANYVPFNVDCTTNNAQVATGSVSDNHGNSLGIDAPQYNTAGTAAQLAKVKNFNLASYPSCNNDSPYCSATLTTDLSDREYYQRYVTDAYYEEHCTSSDTVSTVYTIYPYGSIETYASTEYGEFYTTPHGGLHYIEYSTFKGQYLTAWVLSGIGTPIKKNRKAARFDDYFKEGTTCSGKSIMEEIGSAGLTCKLTVDSTITRLEGCDLDAVASGKTYEEHCCKPTCDYTGEDELTYSFKIVDSENLFPDGGSTSGTPYAVNWYSLDPSNTKKDIEDRAKDGDTFDPSRKTYEFVLTTSDMEAVKAYNTYKSTFDNGLGYADFTLSCKCEGGNNPSGKNCASHTTKCTSSFITNFYAGHVKTNSKTYDLSTTGSSSDLTTLRGNTSPVHWTN